MMNKNIPIGIIGGSGLYEMAGLKDVQHIALDLSLIHI
jgi:purine nucleoside phosphorylase